MFASNHLWSLSDSLEVPLSHLPLKCWVHFASLSPSHSIYTPECFLWFKLSDTREWLSQFHICSPDSSPYRHILYFNISLIFPLGYLTAISNSEAKIGTHHLFTPKPFLHLCFLILVNGSSTLPIAELRLILESSFPNSQPLSWNLMYGAYSSSLVSSLS